MSTERDSGDLGDLLANIPQSANALGSPGAPVRLEYFGDLECPYCRDFTLAFLPSIIETWVRPGKLLVSYRALQTATGDTDVFLAQQVAVLAAGRQERAWQFIESFYREQGEEGSGYVTEAYLNALAGQIPGLDVAKWLSDREDPELAAQISADDSAAADAGLRGTPSFLIGRAAGPMASFSPTDQASFDAAVEALS